LSVPKEGAAARAKAEAARLERERRERMAAEMHTKLKRQEEEIAAAAEARVYVVKAGDSCHRPRRLRERAVGRLFPYCYLFVTCTLYNKYDGLSAMTAFGRTACVPGQSEVDMNRLESYNICQMYMLVAFGASRCFVSLPSGPVPHHWKWR
jgi:hypothetical protein